VQQLLFLLRRTGDVAAVACGLALFANRIRPADRAAHRHLELAHSLGPFGEHRLDDLRDDLSRFLDEHGVALADVLALDLVLVVQRGARDRRPGQLNRLELGHRCELAGAADLDEDAAHPGRRLLRRVFHRDGPARELRGRPGDLPQR
jgi:hypothetical protein